MVELSMKLDEYLPLRDVVFNTLREAILKGELQPGERLMEVSLAQKLGVSRTPIREAIRKLELEGLVKMTPRKGAEVAQITLQDLSDVLEVRRHLEELAVELTCKKASEETLAFLKECHENFKKAITGDNLTEIATADVQLHDAIYESTGNKRLIQILNNLREQMYRYRLEYIKDEHKRNVMADEHERLINAISSRDVEVAKAAIRTHIDNQEKTIIENLTTKEKS